MKFIFWFLLHFTALAEPLEARDPSWFIERMREIEAIGDYPLEERYYRLGELAAIGHHKPLDQEQEIVSKAAQRALISIPGHADFFGNKIRKDRELYAAGRRHEIRGGRTWDFETLGQLPSHETVRVLGSFLTDGPTEAPPDPFNPSSDLANPMENNLLAARALHELKIVSPPLQNEPGCYADVHPWRLWFSQVEAGTRTYRFNRDPQIYGISGPVSEAEARRIADMASRGSQGGRPTPADPTAAIEGNSRSRIIPLVASCVLLAIAIWFGTMRRKSGGPE